MEPADFTHIVARWVGAPKNAGSPQPWFADWLLFPPSTVVNAHLGLFCAIAHCAFPELLQSMDESSGVPAYFVPPVGWDSLIPPLFRRCYKTEQSCHGRAKPMEVIAYNSSGHTSNVRNAARERSSSILISMCEPVKWTS